MSNSSQNTEWKHYLFSCGSHEPWVVPCTGKGANWKDYLPEGTEYPKQVEISAVYVEVSTGVWDTPHDPGPHNGRKFISTQVFVEHNCPWPICNDESIEEALSKELGIDVCFGEQGAQKDGLSFMECKEWSHFIEEQEEGYAELRERTDAAKHDKF